MAVVDDTGLRMLDSVRQHPDITHFVMIFECELITLPYIESLAAQFLRLNHRILKYLGKSEYRKLNGEPTIRKYDAAQHFHPGLVSHLRLLHWLIGQTLYVGGDQGMKG